MSLLLMTSVVFSLVCAVLSAIGCVAGSPRFMIGNLVFAMVNSAFFGYSLRSLVRQWGNERALEEKP